MSKILSISINTFNRYKFLKANLYRLIKEIEKYKLENEVDIFIGDDKSTDETLNLLKNLKNKYSFFEFYSNKKNLGLPANTFKVIEKSPNSKYLYLLSDDDFLKENSLIKIVKILKEKKPDVLYLNYQLVNTYLKKNKVILKKIKSVIGPGLDIKKNYFFKSQKEFFLFLSNLGFYNIRMILAQQSIPITKTDVLKNNLKKLKKTNYDLKKEFYPFDLCLYFDLPEKFLFLKEKFLNITTNNRSWNFDVIKANEVVKKYFNPLQKMILKKYTKFISLKLRLILYLSIFYTNLVPLIYKTAVFFGLKKKIYQLQFGKENEKN